MRWLRSNTSLSLFLDRLAWRSLSTNEAVKTDWSTSVDSLALVRSMTIRCGLFSVKSLYEGAALVSKTTRVTWPFLATRTFFTVRESANALAGRKLNNAINAIINRTAWPEFDDFGCSTQQISQWALSIFVNCNKNNDLRVIIKLKSIIRVGYLTR